MLRKGFLSLAIFVCAPFVQAAELEISFPEEVRLLSTTGRSCILQIDGTSAHVDDLGSVIAQVGSFGLKWQGSNPFNLHYIRIQFHGENLSNMSMVISGRDLAYMWAGGPRMTPILPKDETQMTSPRCSIQLGDIPVKTSEPGVSGSATFEVYGTTLDGQAEVPVSAETQFRFTLI